MENSTCQTKFKNYKNVFKKIIKCQTCTIFNM